MCMFNSNVKKPKDEQFLFFLEEEEWDEGARLIEGRGSRKSRRKRCRIRQYTLIRPALKVSLILLSSLKLFAPPITDIHKPGRLGSMIFQWSSISFKHLSTESLWLSRIY